MSDFGLVGSVASHSVPGLVGAFVRSVVGIAGLTQGLQSQSAAVPAAAPAVTVAVAAVVAVVE